MDSPMFKLAVTKLGPPSGWIHRLPPVPLTIPIDGQRLEACFYVFYLPLRLGV